MKKKYCTDNKPSGGDSIMFYFSESDGIPTDPFMTFVWMGGPVPQVYINGDSVIDPEKCDEITTFFHFAKSEGKTLTRDTVKSIAKKLAYIIL